MAQHLKVLPVGIGFHVACIAIIELLRFAPLESAATSALSLLPQSCQTQNFQVPKKGASQFLTDWH